MWRCARCGARNERTSAHCTRCGMASPFAEDDRTMTIDIPSTAPEPPPRRSTPLPWLIVAAAVVLLLAIVLIALVGLSP